MTHFFTELQNGNKRVQGVAFLVLAGLVAVIVTIGVAFLGWHLPKY